MYLVYIMICIILIGSIFIYDQTLIRKEKKMKGDTFYAEQNHRDLIREEGTSKERLNKIGSLNKQLSDCKKERDEWKQMAMKLASKEAK